MLFCKWTDCAVVFRCLAMAALLAVAVSPAAMAVQIGGLGEPNVIGGSGSYGGTYNTGSFAAINILDQQTGTVSSGSADDTYWINPDNGPANAYIVVDLGAAYRLSSLQMFNSHNGPYNDRGTGNFNIVAGNSITSAGALGMDLTGATTTILSGTMVGQLNSPVAAQNFLVSDINSYRYLRFNPTSVAAGGTPCCGANVYGLTEMRIFATNVTTLNETYNAPVTAGLNSQTVTTTADPSAFRVVKNITNNSGILWQGYDVALQVFNGSSFVASTNVDGISFDSATAEATWAAGVDLLVNGVDQGPPGGSWDVDRLAGSDALTFKFSGFQVEPGDTLSLQFDMRNTTATTTWRLAQLAAPIPEPGTMALWTVVATFGFGFTVALRRRRTSQQR